MVYLKFHSLIHFYKVEKNNTKLFASLLKFSFILTTLFAVLVINLKTNPLLTNNFRHKNCYRKLYSQWLINFYDTFTERSTIQEIN